ncbi:MAG: hypothetical protein MZW92_39680 [Comamonadaceae bacterium]|nr:hypothetical protein [Comamonadaceae bacterium]
MVPAARAGCPAAPCGSARPAAACAGRLAGLLAVADLPPPTARERGAGRLSPRPRAARRSPRPARMVAETAASSGCARAPDARAAGDRVDGRSCSRAPAPTAGRG